MKKFLSLLLCFFIVSSASLYTIGCKTPSETQMSETTNETRLPETPKTPTPQKETYKVSLLTNDMGAVSGGGTFEKNKKTTVYAQPNNGYCFESWTVDGKTVSNSTSYTFTLTDDITLIANFKKILLKGDDYSSSMVVIENISSNKVWTEEITKEEAFKYVTDIEKLTFKLNEKNILGPLSPPYYVLHKKLINTTKNAVLNEMGAWQASGIYTFSKGTEVSESATISITKSFNASMAFSPVKDLTLGLTLGLTVEKVNSISTTLKTQEGNQHNLSEYEKDYYKMILVGNFKIYEVKIVQRRSDIFGDKVLYTSSPTAVMEIDENECKMLFVSQSSLKS